MKALVVLCGMGLFLQRGTAIGQISANALHNRYPAPSREQIQVRPGISITVQYGASLIACEVRIHLTSTSLLDKESGHLMVPDTVTEIIKEISPESERGKAGMSLHSSAGCNWMSWQEYEFVDITRATHECLPLQVARELPAVLTFKWPECAALQKSPRAPPE